MKSLHVTNQKVDLPLLARTGLKSIATYLALCAIGSSALLGSNIGLNFIGRGDPSSLGPNEVAGVVPQKEWNNVVSEPFDGTLAGLTDSDGNFTAVTFEFDANDSWNSNGASGTSATPDEKLMYGIMKVQNVGTSGTFTLHNVPPGNYDVIVYTATDGDGAYIDTTIDDVTYRTICAHQFGGTYIQAKNTEDNPTLRDLGNYVKFTDVAPTEGDIVITTTYQGNGGNGLGLPGVQLIGSGTYPPNVTALGTISAPKAVTVELGPSGAGPSATFSVTTDLPARFQWFRNDVPIPGATASVYSTPPITAADNNAVYRVAANNNVNTLNSDEASVTVLQIPNWLLNPRLNLAESQNQGNTTPTAWTIVSTNLLTGFNSDGAGSAGFANDAASDPDSPYGLWFKPFSGTTNDDSFGGNLIDVHFYQDVIAFPGNSYTFIGHAKAEGNYSGIIDGSPTKSLFALEFLNAAGDVIGGEVVDLHDKIATRAWIDETITAIAPAEAAKVRARASMINGFFSKDPQQSYFVDNFSITCGIPTITSAAVDNGELRIIGTCGTPEAAWDLLMTDDLSKPKSTWTKVKSGVFEGTGGFNVTIPKPSGSQSFYVIDAP